MKDKLVIVRGGGDIATGTIQALYRAGFSLLVLEVADPSAIRRQVALSEAVYDETASVEDVAARLCRSGKAIERAWSKGEIPIIIDPKARAVAELQPWAVVDAILAKRNLGTTKDMARHVIALGPGFTAGSDADAVIETMRGHNLGRIIFEGQAAPNTGVPGLIGGYGKERVVHSPAAGRFYSLARIGSTVEKGQILGVIAKDALPEGYVPGPDDGAAVLAPLTGLVRGLIRDSYPVIEGFKIADIDPRQEEVKNCFTISDKARCIGGAVVTALLWLERRKRQEMEHAQ